MITAQALEILQLKRPRIRDITRKFKSQTRTTWVQQVTPREKQFLKVGTSLWWRISEENKGQNMNQLMTWWSEGTNNLHRRHTYDDHVVDDSLMTFSYENIHEPVTPIAPADNIVVMNDSIYGVKNDIIRDTAFYHGLGMHASADLMTYFWRVN